MTIAQRFNGTYIFDALLNGKESDASEPPVQVLPPWVESPFRLWSWLDMNKFGADVFLNTGAALQWLSSLSETVGRAESIRKLGEMFGDDAATDLRAIGCEVSANAVARFSADFFGKVAKRPLADLRSRAVELESVISDEMGKHLFFWVPSERARYYAFPEDTIKWNDTEKAIDGPISARFKKAATEILEARRSYAVGQYTPCVFHLMRACEVGIKAIYKTLGQAAPGLSDSWGNMLKPMDKQLALKPSDRHGDWAIHSAFFDHATNDVRAIKRAWRDTTMHIESDYNEGEALKALNAVTSFFVHLSEKLDQDGTIH
jgi:HEPN domain-containing protein